MKFTSIFFKASAVYIRGLPQIFKQRSKIHKACFNVFYCDDAKIASFATTEALASQRSTVLTVPKYTFKVSSKIDRNEQKYI